MENKKIRNNMDALRAICRCLNGLELVDGVEIENFYNEMFDNVTSKLDELEQKLYNNTHNE